MKRHVVTYERGGATQDGKKTGIVFSVIETPTKESPTPAKHDLELQFDTTWLSILIARLLGIGTECAKRLRLPSAPPDGEEFGLIVPATQAFATIDKGDEMVVTLRFGVAQVNGLLTIDEARRLSLQLQQVLSSRSPPTDLQ